MYKNLINRQGTYSDYFFALRDYLLGVKPDDSFGFNMPENFEIEVAIYNFFEDTTTIEKRTMTKLDVYYWDEDDHRCCDFYIYNSGRREKLYDLTKESMKKIYDYLYNYLKDNNLIEVDENGHVTKNYNRKNW